MEPTLYILMREDIPDLNPGKAMAQAAHAQADFDAYIFRKSRESSSNTALLSQYEKWCDNRTFGRTLAVAAVLAEIQLVDKQVRDSGVTVDPTYPWRNFNGKLFLSNEVTCGWAFLHADSSEKEIEILKKFSLYA